jgi:hypothetical protein
MVIAHERIVSKLLVTRVNEVTIVEFYQVYESAGRSSADLRSLICPPSHT